MECEALQVFMDSKLAEALFWLVIALAFYVVVRAVSD